jgi:Acyl-CoA reductase (LuxC)
VNIEVLAGTDDFAALAAAAPWRPFDARTGSFLAALAERLHRHPRAAAHIDVVGLAYFCRRSHVEALRERHGARCASSVGRGLSFHIAPSNVPINFAYSLVVGLLSGSTCVVRASSKDFPETTIVCEVLGALMAEPAFADFAGRIAVVRYERDRATNDFFSALCATRLIWGGDATIAEIRRSPLPARAVDIAFADRYSACVIDAAGYTALSDKRAAAIGFYNDTYRSRQAACTAPRLVYWLGDAEQAAAAQARFWAELDAVLLAKGETITAIESVDKLTVLCRLALEVPGTHASQGARITRLEVPALDEALLRHTCGGGLFVELRADDLSALRAFACTKVQTLTYLGLGPEQLVEQVALAGAKGVDRIVPNGAASDFDLVWDGYDLMASLTRHIAVT